MKQEWLFCEKVEYFGTKYEDFNMRKDRISREDRQISKTRHRPNFIPFSGSSEFKKGLGAQVVWHDYYKPLRC